jgi:lysophospholipase L1-like esterase
MWVLTRIAAWFTLVRFDWRAWSALAMGVLLALFGGLVSDLHIVLASGLALVVWALWRVLRPLGIPDQLTDEGARTKLRMAHTGQVLIAWLLFAIGIALFLVWLLVIPMQGLGVIGAILGYVSIGRVLVWLRGGGQPSGPLAGWAVLWMARGPIVLAACAAAFAKAWQMLAPGLGAEPQSPITALVLLAGSVLIAPVGLSLLSEDLLRAMPQGWSVPARWAIAVATFVGAAVLAVTVLVVVPHANDVYSYWTLVLAGLALFVLVGLITAKTQADIFVIVVVLLALVLFAPDETDGPPAAGSGAMLVALGDSYISGEGAHAFYQGTDVAGKNQCHRAASAYPFLYANTHERDYPGGVVTFACSGATVANLVHQEGVSDNGGTPQFGKYEPVDWTRDDKGQTQYEQLDDLLTERGGDVRLILLSVGGNDAGFTTIGITCVGPGHCDDKSKLWLGNLTNVRQSLDDGFADLNATLAEHNVRIPVLVVPYPDPLSEKACKDVTLAQSEVDFVRDLVVELNKRVMRAARTAHFLYVDTMETAMVPDKLRLCDHGNDTGINFVSPQTMNGSPEAQLNPANWVHNSFHPNERGHQAMAAALETWLETNQLTAPKPIDEEVGKDYTEVTPQCALTERSDYAHTGVHCNAQARTWALGETKKFIVAAWPYAIAFLAAVWLVWLSEIARFRRAYGPLWRLKTWVTARFTGA